MNRSITKVILSLLVIFLFSYSNKTFSSVLPGDDAYAAVAETMPEPVGGLPQIYKKISYPVMAVKAGVQGKVYIMAFINENGDVDEAKVIKGIGMGCDEEAVRAVKDSKFKPASNKGQSIKAKSTLAIVFKINN